LSLSKDEASSSNSYHTPPTQSTASSTPSSPPNFSPPRPSLSLTQRVASYSNAEFVDPSSVSMGSGVDDERNELDAAASNLDFGDLSFPSQHVQSESHVATGSGLLSDSAHSNHVRQRMASIFDESQQDNSIHYSESTCFDNVSARRKLYPVIPAGARVMYIGASRLRWSRLSRAYDAWVATGRINDQPLFNAFMSVYDLPLNSCTRLRRKNKHKTNILNRRLNQS
jgi:hypothetical protein